MSTRLSRDGFGRPAPVKMVHLADPATAVVTSTVTEAGYMRARDGHLDVATGGITVLPCDNLPENGRAFSTVDNVLGWLDADLAAYAGLVKRVNELAEELVG